MGRGLAQAVVRLDLLDTDLTWWKRRGRVDEDNERCSTDLVSEFRHELMSLEDRDPNESRVVGEALSSMPTKAVVGAQRVAETDDQDFVGHRTNSSSTVPEGPTSWTRNAISPSACVEHDRQGSKQRITASTRLSIGSVS